MFQSNVTKSRFSNKFIYIKSEALSKLSSPECKIQLGTSDKPTYLDAKVYENENGSGGRLYCPQLFMTSSSASDISLPLQLNDIINYDIVLPGNLRINSIDKNVSRAISGEKFTIDKKSGYDSLLEIGFEDLATWELDHEGVISHIGDNAVYWTSVIKNFPQALYAFCVNADVKYIGKTAVSLRTRFNGYRSPGDTTGPNKRCNLNIKQCISDKLKVRILVLPNRMPLNWGRYSINIAAGLEDALIDDFDPEWNA